MKYQTRIFGTRLLAAFFLTALVGGFLTTYDAAFASGSQTNPVSKVPRISMDSFLANPPIHVLRSMDTSPKGLSPTMIKSIYHLPQTGGTGTIALIEAHADASLEKDLSQFDDKFGIQTCNKSNKCLNIHSLGSSTPATMGWALETALDVEWAHAIAPSAKILVVEARSTSLKDLLAAIDYARNSKDVVSISMSWGGKEFDGEESLDNYFTNKGGAPFFASSGDNGTGVSWPAASVNVISVGGTTLNFDAKTNLFSKESAWSGSGGGMSTYEHEPAYQVGYVNRSGAMRAVPDVSYNADPTSGFSVYSSRGGKTGGWYVIGGTSAGAPQWAAIQALGKSIGKDISNDVLYTDKASSMGSNYFRDIISGSNGICLYYCTARRHYDYVTGLGSPLTFKF